MIMQNFMQHRRLDIINYIVFFTTNVIGITYILLARKFLKLSTHQVIFNAEDFLKALFYECLVYELWT